MTPSSRGTTSARTIRPAARGRCCRGTLPDQCAAVRPPCYFGTDIPDEKDLIATGHTVEEINGWSGHDTLGYFEH